MTNQSQIIHIDEGVRLHLIDTQKFKTLLMGVYIKRPLNIEEVSLNAMLSRMIDRSTASHPGITDVNKTLENLYGTLLVSDVHKYGEKQMIQIKLNVPDEKLIGDPSLYKKVLSLLNEVLNHPNIIDEGFDPQIFEQAKEGLITEIKNRKEDKAMWALSRCLENMCQDEPYALHEYGLIEAIEKMTPQALLSHFYEIMATSEIDILLNGNVDESIVDLIKETLTFKRGELKVLPEEQVVYHVDEVKSVTEYDEGKQARLVLGYRMNIPYSDDKYLPALLGSVILGYGGSSKLFRIVREKESLCYSIFARTEKYKSVMYVYAGVEPQKADQAEKLMKSIFESMKTGDITNEEVEIAKSNLISSLFSITDFQNAYLNYYYSQYLSGSAQTLDEYRDRIQKVTRESIIEAVQFFELDTVYLMSKEVTHA